MVLLSKSKYYSLYQSDQEKCYFIDFGNKTVKASFCQLLALRQKVNAINITNHFYSSENKHGIEILTLCNKEHLFVLNTSETLDLQALIKDSFISLGLSTASKKTVPL